MIQRGRLHAARELLERSESGATDPFAPLRRQRRLASLCRLYSTVNDKWAMFRALAIVVDLAVDVRWSILGDVGSQIDDLVNLACQFGEEQVAQRAIETGRTIADKPATMVWLDIATVRF